MPKSRAAVTQLIHENIMQLAVHLNLPLVRLLSVGRELCDKDLDAFLILLVIVGQANRHEGFAALDPEAVNGGRVAELPSYEINMQSIADSTGIPKETVRRKVNRLLAKGWIERVDSMLRFTPEGYRAITPAREAAVQMAAGLVAAIEARR